MLPVSSSRETVINTNSTTVVQWNLFHPYSRVPFPSRSESEPDKPGPSCALTSLESTFYQDGSCSVLQMMYAGAPVHKYHPRPLKWPSWQQKQKRHAWNFLFLNRFDDVLQIGENEIHGPGRWLTALKSLLLNENAETNVAAWTDRVNCFSLLRQIIYCIGEQTGRIDWPFLSITFSSIITSEWCIREKRMPGSPSDKLFCLVSRLHTLWSVLSLLCGVHSNVRPGQFGVYKWPVWESWSHERLWGLQHRYCETVSIDFEEVQRGSPGMNGS